MQYFPYVTPVSLKIGALINDNIESINKIYKPTDSVLKNLQFYTNHLLKISEARQFFCNEDAISEYNAQITKSIIQYWEAVTELSSLFEKCNLSDLKKPIEYKMYGSIDSMASTCLSFESACISYNLASIFSVYGSHSALSRDYKTSSQFYKASLYFFNEFYQLLSNSTAWTSHFGDKKIYKGLQLLIEVKYLEIFSKFIKGANRTVKSKNKMIADIYYTISVRTKSAFSYLKGNELARSSEIYSIYYNLNYLTIKSTVILDINTTEPDGAKLEDISILCHIASTLKPLILTDFKNIIKTRINDRDRQILYGEYGIDLDILIEKWNKLIKVAASNIKAADEIEGKYKSISIPLGYNPSSYPKGSIAPINEVISKFIRDIFESNSEYRELFDSWTLWIKKFKVKRSYQTGLECKDASLEIIEKDQAKKKIVPALEQEISYFKKIYYAWVSIVSRISLECLTKEQVSTITYIMLSQEKLRGIVRSFKYGICTDITEEELMALLIHAKESLAHHNERLKDLYH
jgi:hypothetical protein